MEKLLGTIADRIADSLDKYHKKFKSNMILKSSEEVEACTDNDKIPSALVVGELINDLTVLSGNGQIQSFHVGEDGKPYITYKTSVGGADTNVS